MNHRPCSRYSATVSFEVMPPRNPDAAPRFWATIDRLASVHPDFISVTYGAGGRDRSTAPTIINRLIHDTPVEPIAHLTCVGTSMDQVAHTITDYLDTGERTFLALRGDPPVDQPGWTPEPGGPSSATQLVALIRAVEAQRCSRNPAAKLRGAFMPLTIAVAAFPAGNPAVGTTQEQEVERLLVKQAAGASFAITQLFWEPETYLSFVEAARASGVSIPIVAGLLPPTDPRRIRRVTDLTGIEAPQPLLEALSREDIEEKAYERGIAEGARIAREVLRGGAPGLHLYTFNQAAASLDLLAAVGFFDPVG